MSKRQRRRVAERRSVHMQHTKRRTVLPVALAAVAAPGLAAPVAQASPRILRFDGTVVGHAAPHNAEHAASAHLSGDGASVGGGTRTADEALARADSRLRREHATAAKAIANATLTGGANALYRPKPNPPRRLSGPMRRSPRTFAPVQDPAAVVPETPAPPATATPAASGPAEAGSAIAPTPAPQVPAGAPAAPSPALAGSAIAPTPAPAPAPQAPSAADAGSAIAPALGPAPPAATPGQVTAQANPQTINPDAPPMVPNPTPTTGTGGVSVGASYYDGVGGGATLVATPQGLYIVPEFGIGFGPSVSAAAGSNVNVPNAPQLQLGFTGGDQIGPIGYRGSGTITVPLNDPSNPNVGVNLGFNAPGSPSLTNIPGTSIPLTNLRVSGNYSPASGVTGGLQYSGTNQLFNVTDQVKLAVRVPIPLPDLTQTTPPDANGVSDMITPTGEGPPAIVATRNVSNLGYPDGQGDTVTLNPDGSYTVHTPTGDVTNFSPNYLQQQGLDSSQGGQLTHLLIDTLGQRTDQWSWQGSDGTKITRTESGTLTQTNPDGTTMQQSTSGVVTQTNADGSSVIYDQSTGNITTKDSGWFGPTTTFYPDGSVSQTSPAGTTMWDSSGHGTTLANSLDGPGFPMSTSEPAPTAPVAPSFIFMPHDPNVPVFRITVWGDAPAPTSNDQSSNGDNSDTPVPADTTQTPSPTPAPADAAPGDVAPGDVAPGDAAPGDAAPGDVAPGDVAPADVAPADVAPADVAPADVAPADVAPADAAPADAAPADVAPTDAAPADVAPAPAPVDTAPVDTAPVDTAPAPVDVTPAPVDAAPPPVDATPPPVDITPPPVDAPPAPVDITPPPVDAPPAPVDMTPAPVDITPPSVDTTPPVDMTPAPVDITPPPVDTTPAPVDTPPSLDSGSLDSGSLDSGGFGGGGGGGDGAALEDMVD